MRSDSKGFSVLLYMGWCRPPARRDLGAVLLDRLAAGRHRVAAVLVRQGDLVAAEVRRRGWRCIRLPPELCHGARAICRALARPTIARRFRQWLDSLEALGADVGVVFYGSWLPPALHRLPRLGFINFHPAPLPELKGYEPETMAVLQDRRTIRGTVHAVSDSYDGGRILARTRSVRIGRHTTPPDLWRRLTRPGIDALLRVLDRLATTRDLRGLPIRRRSSLATLNQVRREARIDWARDDLRRIDCRLRAFCTQDIGIRLEARLGRHWRAVQDVEGYRGSYPGRPGRVLGFYTGRGVFRNAPIVRTVDGVAVVRPVSPGSPARPPLLPGGRRPHRTHRGVVRASLKSRALALSRR